MEPCCSLLTSGTIRFQGVACPCTQTTLGALLDRTSGLYNQFGCHESVARTYFQSEETHKTVCEGAGQVHAQGAACILGSLDSGATRKEETASDDGSYHEDGVFTLLGLLPAALATNGPESSGYSSYY